MIVADASIIVPLLVWGHERASASERLLRAIPNWIAPPLWRSEVLSALFTYLRAGLLTVEHAKSAYDQAENIVTDAAFTPDGRLLGLAHQVRCTIYDAQYAALAQSSGLPLVSNDRKLVSAFRAFARTPEEMLLG